MKNLVVSEAIYDGREKLNTYKSVNCKTPFYFTVKAGKLEIPVSLTDARCMQCGYPSRELAHLARKKFIEETPWNNKLAIVTVNSDRIEGRGHQVFDAIFEELSDAYDYVASQEHSYMHKNDDGSLAIEFGVNCDGELYSHTHLGLYRIELVELNCKSKNILL